MTWRTLFSPGHALSNPHRVREMPLPGGPPPEEREALQAVHAQLEGLTKTQALRVLHTVAEQVRRDWR